MSLKKTRRGGSWGYGGLATARDDSSQAEPYYGCGFRLAAQAQPQPKLLRGSSWTSFTGYASCSVRTWNRDLDRERHIGFRLAGRVSK